MAEIRLGVGEDWGFGEVLQLHFEHLDPGTLGGLVVRERIVAEGPGVAFTPEPIHKGVHELDVRAAVKFAGKLDDEVAEALLKKGIVKAGLVARVGVLQVSLGGGAIASAGKNEIDLGDAVEDKVGQRRRVRIVGSAHLNAEGEALVVSP